MAATEWIRTAQDSDLDSGAPSYRRRNQDDVDEAELDAELELLGAEMEMEGGMEAGGVPDFMRDEVPEFIDEPPETAKVQEAAR